jgi:NAD(P)-dependent dehydrogenase (short-subunit alcohol dehydrogenase family)
VRSWALVALASRGIGAALTRRVLQTTNVPVIAAARNDPDEAKEHILKDLKDVDEARLIVLAPMYQVCYLVKFFTCAIAHK